MVIKMGKTKIEERGRVLIPKSIRERTGVRPGEEVEIMIEEGKIVIVPLIDVENFSRELKGCVKESEIKPEEIKGIWRM